MITQADKMLTSPASLVGNRQDFIGMLPSKKGTENTQGTEVQKDEKTGGAFCPSLEATVGAVEFGNLPGIPKLGFTVVLVTNRPYPVCLSVTGTSLAASVSALGAC